MTSWRTIHVFDNLRVFVEEDDEVDVAMVVDVEEGDLVLYVWRTVE